MGDAFGLSPTLRYFEYEFDSQDADQGASSTESKLDWPIFQMERPLNNIAGLKIIEAQIPFSFYIINSFNNTFVLTSIAGSFTITIPPGNYDSSSLIAATTLAISTADPSDSIVVTFSQITGKFTFYRTVPFSLTFGTSTDNGDNNLAFIYGFNTGTTSSGIVLSAPNVAQIQGPLYLYINSEKLGTLCQLYLPASAELSQGGLGPEMAKIPVNTTPFCIINWQDPDPHKYFDVESLFSIQSLDFFLTLGKNPRKPLRLNGLSFSLKLGILVNSDQRTDSTVGGPLKRIRAV